MKTLPSATIIAEIKTTVYHLREAGKALPMEKKYDQKAQSIFNNIHFLEQIQEALEKGETLFIAEPLLASR